MSWLAGLLLALASFVVPVGDLPQPVQEPLANLALDSGSSHQASLLRPLASTIPPQPIKRTNQPLQLSAKGAYAMDLETGQTLYSLQPDEPRPIASLAKIATALVILQQHDEDKVITIPDGLPSYPVEAVTLGLTPGQRFTTRELLAALLIPSANDAADALAVADSGSKAAFVAKMNAVPRRWGITGAQFSDPSGLDDTGSHATPRSLAKLGALLLHSPTAAQIVASPTATIRDQAGQAYPVINTDTLLSNGQFRGIKTGYTPAAGQCFVGLTTASGHKIITVILGSTDRFGDSQRLAAWVERNYQWY